MSTSGSVDFSVTRNDLIEHALKQIGVLGEGETPASAQYTEGAWLLNALVKARMSDGMPLWALKTGYVLPTTGVSSVALGSTGNTVTSYVTTTLSVAAAAAATTVTLTSPTGFAASQAIGIALDDGTMQWTTINGALVGSIATLTVALTSAASAGAIVYAYTTTNRIVRPLRIISAYMLTTLAETRNPLTIITKDQYFSLGDYNSYGVPNQVYYDPQLSAGVFYFFPQFSGGNNVIQITFHRPYEDFDTSTDTPDFPQEWYLSLMLDLAALQGAKAGVPITERKALQSEAKMWRDLALENGTEEGSFFMQPHPRMGK